MIKLGRLYPSEVTPQPLKSNLGCDLFGWNKTCKKLKINTSKMEM